jgi:malate dehydrogenase (oxaloacetate-decarboxylating)(NADP+)
VFPGVVVQFEDFANHNAFRLLQKYRDRICSFNDDIQGTASGDGGRYLLGAARDRKPLGEQTFLCLGAGEAATGISDLLVAAMVPTGWRKRRPRSRCWLVDSKGWSSPGAATSPSTRSPTRTSTRRSGTSSARSGH